MTQPSKAIEYLEKKTSRLTSLIPNISDYDEDLKIDAVIFHLQRLTNKMKSDLGEQYEEHQLALLLLDSIEIIKAFGIQSGFFEEISKMDFLTSEDEYNAIRTKFVNTMRIIEKERSCC